MSYGLYIIGTRDGEKYAGCVVNTVTQATSSPVTLTVCINKDNYTNACIKKCKEFSVSILSENTAQGIIGIFGFSSGRDTDKFPKAAYGLTPSGLPYIKEGAAGYLQCKVIDCIDDYTHTIFIAEVQEAENISDAPPMTYAYYHNVIKGKTPKNASTFVNEPKEEPGASYVCSVCGYVYPGGKEEFERLPDDYRCPICRVAKSKFVMRVSI